MPRTIDIGDVMGRAFSTYGAQAGLVIPAALLVFLPLAVLEALLGGDGGAGGIVAAVISVIASFWFQGMVVEAVRDIQDGRRDFTLGELFRAPAPVLGSLIAAGVLAGVGIMIGFVLLVVPGLLLLTWWAVVIPVVVVERPPLLEAFSRSRDLVRDNGWQVFGLLIVVLVMLVLVSVFLTVFAVLLSDTATSQAIASLLSNLTVVPLLSITVATLYFALRDAHGEAPVPALAERSYGPGGGFSPPQSPTPDRPDIGLS
jgi:hypothetical protein